MVNARETAAFILVLLLAFSVSISAAQKANAVVAAPEFSVHYVDASFDVPPTYGVDQYTGQTVVTVPAEHVDNRSIEITIKNAPFMPYTDDGGNTINRFYDVRYKGEYNENWTNMFGNQTQAVWAGQANPYSKYGYLIQDYTSEYTTISYHFTWQMPEGGQMDFQVQALEGYTTKTPVDSHILFSLVSFHFYGQSSSWSSTKTIQFGDNTAFLETSATSPLATPVASVPELSAVIILPLLVCGFAAVLMVKHRRGKHD